MAGNTNNSINSFIPIQIADGGTNQTTFNTDGVVYFDGTSLNSTAVGTSGYVLTSQGSGMPPIFSAAGSSSISITGDTGGTLTGGSFTFTGGTTGLSFGGSGSTETLTFAGITANNGVVNLGTDNATNAINIGLGTSNRIISIGNSSASNIIDMGSTGTSNTINMLIGTGSITNTLTIGNGFGATNGVTLANSGNGTNDITIASGSLASNNIVIGSGVSGTNSVTIANGSGIGTNTVVIANSPGQSPNTVTIGNSSTAVNTITIGGSFTGSTLVLGSANNTVMNGVFGVTSSNPVPVTIDSVTGQLGSGSSSSGITTLEASDATTATGSTVTITASGNVSTTASGSTLTINLTNSPTFGSVTTGGVTSSGAINITSGSLTLSSGSISISGGTLALPATTSSPAAGYMTIGGTNFLSAPPGSNTYVGLGAGLIQSGISSTEPLRNTAFGFQALSALTAHNSITDNTAVGYEAGHALTTANVKSTALGSSAMAAATGNSCTALGYSALAGANTGSNNTIIGATAGSNYVNAEASNILINSPGTASESNVCRIGSGTGTGTQQLNAAFISGIQTIGITGTAVLVSSSDQLGVAVSSRRYKDSIESLTNETDDLYKLNPVSFIYKENSESGRQTGLIAEEVYDVMPQLVVLDKEGLPLTVKYHDLSVLLLNEIQRLNKRILALEAKG
jgi:hypothetical protein